MSNLIYAIIFLFIGWNFPQPPWAKSIQDKATTWFINLWNKKEDNDLD